MICLQVIKRKKEEANSGNTNYIESSLNPAEKTVSSVFKGLGDDLDEQDENDVGKKKIQLPAIIFRGILLSTPFILASCKRGPGRDRIYHNILCNSVV